MRTLCWKLASCMLRHTAVLVALVAMPPTSHAGMQQNAGTRSSLTNRPQDQPIFANAAFRFFADRLEATDFYSGVYRSSNGVSITKDGDAAYTWTNARLNKLCLQTPYPILDAAFALGVDSALSMRASADTVSAQLAGGQPGGIYHQPYFYWTHGADVREYTRDSAQPRVE